MLLNLIVCLYVYYISFPEGAQQYTFLQSSERMRRLKRRCFPATPRNLAELHYLLVADENEEYTLTLQTPPNK